MKPARIFSILASTHSRIIPKGCLIIAQRFQRWVRDCRCLQSPEGTAETVRSVNRPFGTCAIWVAVPNAEALGYCQASLRDETAPRDLHSGVIITLAN